MNELPYEEIEKLLNEAFQAKVWMDVNRVFLELDIEEQSQILNEFESIAESYGERSKEMGAFFHKYCMKFSKLYYFTQTRDSENNDWDEAFQKELQ